MDPIRNTLLTILPLFIVVFSQISSAQDPFCSMDLSNHYGPYDFYDPANHQGNTRVNIVVGAHLTQSMLQMKRGNTGLEISTDLDYTLRAIPNHPQALDLASRLERAVRLGQKPKSERLDRTVNCYFLRALKLNGDVPETLYVWGLHFQRNGKLKEAHDRFEKAEELGIGDALFDYNYGLLYFSLGDMKQAKTYADKAYGAGVAFPGLRNKLKNASAW